MVHLLSTLPPHEFFRCPRTKIFFNPGKYINYDSPIVLTVYHSIRLQLFSELETSPSTSSVFLWVHPCSLITTRLANQPTTAPAVSHIINFISSIFSPFRGFFNQLRAVCPSCLLIQGTCGVWVFVLSVTVV